MLLIRYRPRCRCRCWNGCLPATSSCLLNLFERLTITTMMGVVVYVMFFVIGLYLYVVVLVQVFFWSKVYLRKWIATSRHKSSSVR